MSDQTNNDALSQDLSVSAAAPVVAPRTKVYIADRPFYVDKSNAFNFISIEAATKGMDRSALEDWIARYSVRIEMWADSESFLKVMLTDGEKVLGNWI